MDSLCSAELARTIIAERQAQMHRDAMHRVPSGARWRSRFGKRAQRGGGSPPA
jgi:hypothetical protein